MILTDTKTEAILVMKRSTFMCPILNVDTYEYNLEIPWCDSCVLLSTYLIQEFVRKEYVRKECVGHVSSSKTCWNNTEEEGARSNSKKVHSYSCICGLCCSGNRSVS